MQSIKDILNRKDQLRQESNRTAFEQTPPPPDKALNTSPEKLEYFWKTEFIRCLQKAEPRFRVDDSNRNLLQALYNWVWKTPESVLDPNKGLFIWGPIGVGKSLIMKGLRNYEGKINQFGQGFSSHGMGFNLVSAAELALQYANNGLAGIEKYITPHRMTHLAIDEVGREPRISKHFGTDLNVIQLILQLRYEHWREIKTHLTTNLDPDKDFHIYGDFVVDRVKEMFNVVEMRGESRR